MKNCGQRAPDLKNLTYGQVRAIRAEASENVKRQEAELKAKLEEHQRRFDADTASLQDSMQTLASLKIKLDSHNRNLSAEFAGQSLEHNERGLLRLSGFHTSEGILMDHHKKSLENLLVQSRNTDACFLKVVRLHASVIQYRSIHAGVMAQHGISNEGFTSQIQSVSERLGLINALRISEKKAISYHRDQIRACIEKITNYEKQKRSCQDAISVQKRIIENKGLIDELERNIIQTKDKIELSDSSIKQINVDLGAIEKCKTLLRAEPSARGPHAFPLWTPELREAVGQQNDSEGQKDSKYSAVSPELQRLLSTIRSCNRYLGNRAAPRKAASSKSVARKTRPSKAAEGATFATAVDLTGSKRKASDQAAASSKKSHISIDQSVSVRVDNFIKGLSDAAGDLSVGPFSWFLDSNYKDCVQDILKLGPQSLKVRLLSKLRKAVGAYYQEEIRKIETQMSRCMQILKKDVDTYCADSQQAIRHIDSIDDELKNSFIAFDIRYQSVKKQTLDQITFCRAVEENKSRSRAGSAPRRMRF